MDDQQFDEEETGKNFKVDLLSSLFGTQIASGILNHDTSNEDYNSERCTNPAFIGKTCLKCGQLNDGTTSTIPFWYIYPNLNLSLNEIDRIRDTNLQTLISRKKLHLVIDLDHTLVHTRKFYKLSPEDKQFLRTKREKIDYNAAGELCTLYKMSCEWTKLRPFVRSFLKEASAMFEMTIYTLGCRSYAWNTAKLLDPNGEYFHNWRVISREDCVELDKHNKSLDVILEHERVVLVMDDSEDVWEEHKKSLIKVKPYNFFSYFSPQDKVHDASPAQGSWSQLNGDESEGNGELATVLDKLRAVHAAFYDDSAVKGKQDFLSRDVREVLKRVMMSKKALSKRQKKQFGNKIK